MSDAGTTQSVECPICGDEFDPTVAGGWCTNTECGEWQYTDATGDEQDDEDGFVSANDTDDSEDGFVSASEMDDTEDDAAEDESEKSAVFAADDESDADDEEADEPEVAAEEDDDAAEPEVDDATDEAAEEDDDAAEPEVDDATDEVAEEDDEAAEPEADAAEPEVDDATDEAAEEDDDAAEAQADEADTIDCPDCGVELEADANFCLECGADVSDVSPDSPLTACPSCEADIDEGANFCVNCGEDLTAHHGDAATEEDATDDASGDAVDVLSEDEPVPESLVLAVEGREITVDDGEKVGREIRAALMDAGRPEEEAVRIHREHVRFVREDDSFYLLDLGDNPTALNGRTLTKGDREPVAPGDDLELSGVAEVDIRAP